MADLMKRYILASDFDQTLSFNDSGYALSEMLGISTEEFERKASGMAGLQLVQQGAELAYLLLHDPEFHGKVRRHHLAEVGKRIRLKENIDRLYDLLSHGIPGFEFDFYVLSAAPVEIVRSALENIVPPGPRLRNRIHLPLHRAKSKPCAKSPPDTAKSQPSTRCNRSCRSDPITSCTAETGAPTCTSCCT